MSCKGSQSAPPPRRRDVNFASPVALLRLTAGRGGSARPIAGTSTLRAISGYSLPYLGYPVRPRRRHAPPAWTSARTGHVYARVERCQSGTSGYEGCQPKRRLTAGRGGSARPIAGTSTLRAISGYSSPSTSTRSAGLDISSYWTRVRKGGTMPVGHLRINRRGG
jgi:hypothetical protein